MPTTTTNLGLYKPLVNDPTDQDLWGAYLNTNLDTLDTAVDAIAPAGVVVPYAGSSAPSGWIICNGGAVSRTTYAKLFAVIGTTYGTGDGSTTFNVPDLRGRAVFGVDGMGGTPANRVTSAGSGVDGASLGASGGSQLTQQHTHTVTDPAHSHGQSGATALNAFGSNQAWQSGSVFIQQGGNTAAATTGISIANYGSGTSQNMPPSIMLNYIIKS